MNKIINGLSIIATPIGNLDDITYRAVSTLKDCDIIICENPKHSLKLLNKLGIKKKLIALHDYNEQKIIDQIKGLLKSKNCVLISDAGSPLISDPGYNLVKYCIENDMDSMDEYILPIIRKLELARVASITSERFLKGELDILELDENGDIIWSPKDD